MTTTQRTLTLYAAVTTLVMAGVAGDAGYYITGALLTLAGAAMAIVSLSLTTGEGQ